MRIYLDKYTVQKKIIYICFFVSILFFGLSFISHQGLSIAAFFLNNMIFTACAVTVFKPLPNVFNNISNCSMGIYLIHHPIIWNAVANEWIRYQLCMNPYLASFILILTSFLISWLLTYLILKIKYIKLILG